MNVEPKRNYRDTLFKKIFGSEENKHYLLQLYNALNNSHYENPNDLQLTTIENIIYVTIKNDVSFLIESEMTLYEQQATYNPNMPLRGLMYYAQLYQEYLSGIKRNLYSTRLIKIPNPNFIVFYNGPKETEDEVEFKLSNAFITPQESPKFEWTAKMLNINKNHNVALQKKCEPLYYYVEFANRVNSNIKKGLSAKQAMTDAVDYAIKHNFYGDFFKKQKSEVLNMSLTEFNQEEYDREKYDDWFEEGKAEGRILGIKEGILETAKKFKIEGISVSAIAKCTGLSLAEIQKL